LFKIIRGENPAFQEIEDEQWRLELQKYAWDAATAEGNFSEYHTAIDSRRHYDVDQIFTLADYQEHGDPGDAEWIVNYSPVGPGSEMDDANEFIEWFFKTNPDPAGRDTKGMGAQVEQIQFLKQLLYNLKYKITNEFERFAKYIKEIQYYFPHTIAEVVFKDSLLNCKLNLYLLNMVSTIFLKYPLKTTKQFTDAEIWQKAKKSLEKELGTVQWGEPETALEPQKKKQLKLFREVLPAQAYQVKKTGGLKDTTYQWCKKLVSSGEVMPAEIEEEPTDWGSAMAAQGARENIGATTTISKAYVKDLILEEFTKADIKDIVDDAIEKKMKSELPKALKTELEKALKSKEIKSDVGEIAKKVLKKLYKDLSFHHPYIIDRIKV
jgi:hypothetical protein